MPVKFSGLTIAFGAVLIDTEGDGYFKVVTEENGFFWVNQLDALLSSGVTDDLMSKTVEKDWMVLV